MAETSAMDDNLTCSALNTAASNAGSAATAAVAALADFKNPMANASCGCGSSFSIKI